MADLTVTAANVLNVSGTQSAGIAGETITAGQCLYLKSSDGKYYKAKASGTAEEASAAGIALHGALAGQPITFATDGPMNVGATTAKSTVYVVSATAGGIAPIADLTSTNRVTHLGYATATDGSLTVRRTATGVTL